MMAYPPRKSDCAQPGKVTAGELATLVGVENFRAAVAGNGLSHRIQAEIDDQCCWV